MRRLLSSILRSMVGGVLLLIAITAVAPILAWLQSLPWYVIALSAIGSFGLSLFAINQFAVFQERRSRGFATQSNEKIEETIRNWLDDPVFKFQRKVDPNCLFRFIITDEPGRPITISRSNLKPMQLELATAITLSSEQREKYETLSLGEKQKIMHDVRIEMARYGISYTGIDTKLERITLSDTVLLDNSLTEFYLRQRIFFVIRAFVLYAEIIGQQLMLLGKRDSNKEDFQTQ